MISRCKLNRKLTGAFWDFFFFPYDNLGEKRDKVKNYIMEHEDGKNIHLPSLNGSVRQTSPTGTCPPVPVEDIKEGLGLSVAAFLP